MSTDTHQPPDDDRRGAASPDDQPTAPVPPTAAAEGTPAAEAPREEAPTDEPPIRHAETAPPAPTPDPDAPAPAAPPALAAVTAQGGVISRLVRSRPLEALELARRVPGFWIATALVAALVIGVAVSFVVARAAAVFQNAASMMLPFGGSEVYFGLSFGQWVQVLLLVLVPTLIIFALRVLAVQLVFLVRGRPQSFAPAASTVAAGYVLHPLIFVLSGVLILIPGDSVLWVVLVLSGVTLAAGTLLAELVIYIGINRTVPLTKSPLIPHVLLTGGWMLASLLVLWATGRIAVAWAMPDQPAIF